MLKMSMKYFSVARPDSGTWFRIIMVYVIAFIAIKPNKVVRHSLFKIHLKFQNFNIQ